MLLPACEDRLAAQRAARDDKAARLRAAEADLTAVLQEWAQVRQALQRPDGEDPATTIELLELLNELDGEQQAGARLRNRLREMQDEIAAFRTSVAELAARIARDLAAEDAFATVQALRQLLNQHRALAKQHETLAAALKRADTAVTRQQKQRDDAGSNSTPCWR